LFSLSTGSDNQAFGTTALYLNTTGSSNTAVGRDALRSNTTSSYNTAVGYQAGYSTSTTGGHNTFVGYQSGYTNTTADRSVYLGDNTGYAATGRGNTYIGCDAGYVMTTGASNTILGRFSGNQSNLDIRTASNNIVLSDGDGNPQIHTNSSSWTNLTWGTIDISQNSGSSANVNVVAITSGTATPLFGGGNAFSGVIIINDINNTGTAALIISAGNSITIISQTSTTFVVSSSPTSGQIGIYLSGSVIVLKPGVTGTTYFRIITFRTRTTQ
jgi:hypothetical protein